MTSTNETAIVTDSTADLPEDIVQANRISVVPNLVIIEGKSLEDGIDITRKEFYEQLPEMKSVPTTATASAGAYQQLYEKLLNSSAQAVLSIHAASKLSGIYNAASAAAQDFGKRVRVVDSQQISLGLGFQALKAAEAAARGATIEAIERLLDELRKRLRVVAMLDTLEYVRRSGRVSWARAHIGNLLRIKPFLEVRDGQVLSLGESRTRSKGIKRLKEFLLEFGELERLAILHTNAEGDALQFIEDLALPAEIKPLIINVTTVIGAHVGPNGLGFSAVLK